MALFHFELHNHLFTVKDNACMYVGKEGAIRGVKCTIRFAPRCSFWHIGHLWRAGLVAPRHAGCVFGRRPAHPLRYFSPLVTIWRGDSVNKIRSTSLVDLLIALSLSVLQQPEREIRAHTREFTQVFFFFLKWRQTSTCLGHSLWRSISPTRSHTTGRATWRAKLVSFFLPHWLAEFDASGIVFVMLSEPHRESFAKPMWQIRWDI